MSDLDREGRRARSRANRYPGRLHSRLTLDRLVGGGSRSYPPGTHSENYFAFMSQTLRAWPVVLSCATM
jgi:hypothetical protein